MWVMGAMYRCWAALLALIAPIAHIASCKSTGAEKRS